MAKNQPTAIAGMEGLFRSEKGAGMIVMGQPNFEIANHRQSAAREQSFELSDLRNYGRGS